MIIRIFSTLTAIQIIFPVFVQIVQKPTNSHTPAVIFASPRTLFLHTMHSIGNIESLFEGSNTRTPAFLDASTHGRE
jgi:hypothetical protein